MSRDPEWVTWSDWAGMFHQAIKGFVRDMEAQPPPPDSPLARLTASLKAASEEYDRALAARSDIDHPEEKPSA